LAVAVTVIVELPDSAGGCGAADASAANATAPAANKIERPKDLAFMIFLLLTFLSQKCPKWLDAERAKMRYTIPRQKGGEDSWIE
jgi:hypothetical protein